MFGLFALLILAILAVPSAALDLDLDPDLDLGTVLSQQSNLSTYSALLKSHPDFLLQLPGSYGGITVIAPDDAAFSKLAGAWDPSNASLAVATLQYHMLRATVSTATLPTGPSRFYPSLLDSDAYTNVTGGQNVVVSKQPGDVIVFTSGDGSRSTVVQGDINFSGGLLHVVDSLMVPPSRLEHTARDAYTDMTAFLAALYRANLTAEFSECPDATILAPRNAAFELVAGALESLDPSDLANVLRYHLVPGGVMPSITLTNGTRLTTAADDDEDGRRRRVRVVRSGDNVYFNSAQLVQPDILIANGVVHMIDNVLNPAKQARPDPVLPVQSPVFAPDASAAKSGAPVPFAGYLPCTSACPMTTTTTTGGNSSQGPTATGLMPSATATAANAEPKGASARTRVPVLLFMGGLVLVVGIMGT